MTTHSAKATKPDVGQSPISPQAVITEAERLKKQTEILKEEVAQLKGLIDCREREFGLAPEKKGRLAGRHERNLIVVDAFLKTAIRFVRTFVFAH